MRSRGKGNGALCAIYRRIPSYFSDRSVPGEGSSDVAQSLSSALASAFDSIHNWNLHAGAKHLVLVLGATNEPWAVDEGFLRQGRFDRAVFVGPLKREEQAYLHARVTMLQRSSSKRQGETGLDLRRGRGGGGGGDSSCTASSTCVHLNGEIFWADLQLLVQQHCKPSIAKSRRLRLGLRAGLVCWSCERRTLGRPVPVSAHCRRTRNEEYRKWGRGALELAL